MSIRYYQVDNAITMVAINFDYDVNLRTPPPPRLIIYGSVLVNTDRLGSKMTVFKDINVEVMSDLCH